jgi:fumarylacetoacetate (FAA) hydrolase
MKLCNLILDNKISLGAEVDGKIVNLSATIRQMNASPPGDSIEELLEDWPRSFEKVRELMDEARKRDRFSPVNGKLVFAPPVRRPGTFRDFYAFEQHVTNARKLRGVEVNSEWYEAPVFYFSNPNTISTTGAVIKFPAESKKWDYECEIGTILGGEGSDLTPAEAEKLIAGYVILNDWSCRDIQRHEMSSSMGPAKGKDFATSIGHLLVTPDELEDRRTAKGYNLKLKATVRGIQFTDNNWSTIHFSIPEMIARASKNCAVYAGELFGSGTTGLGCLLERGFDHELWLRSGNEVVVEIERLGKLVNRIA